MLGQAIRQLGIASCDNDRKVRSFGKDGFREFGAGHARHRLVCDEKVNVVFLAQQVEGLRSLETDRTV